ncbi:MAG: hypothetical protein ACRDVK_07785 [Acidimicrobiia bacterium]
MVKVYAVALALGAVLLIAWIFSVYLAGNVEAWSRISPEERFGKRGRQMVAALVGFGMAGMSAEFSPRDLPWPISLVLAVLGAAAATWYSTWIDRPRTEHS